MSLKVWSNFSSLKDPDVKFRIVDMPVDRLEDVVNLAMEYFAPEEITMKSAGVSKSDEAMAERRKFITKLYGNTEKVFTQVCCVDNGTEEVQEIIGASIMELVVKGDSKTEFNAKNQELRKVYAVFEELGVLYEAVSDHKLDRNLIDRGVVVHPNYRGCGIAQELFKTRRLLCKELGVAMSQAWMTSVGSQKAAQRDGWETIMEVNPKDLENKTGITFEDGTPNLKCMIARIR